MLRLLACGLDARRVGCIAGGCTRVHRVRVRGRPPHEGAQAAPRARGGLRGRARCTAAETPSRRGSRPRRPMAPRLPRAGSGRACTHGVGVGKVGEVPMGGLALTPAEIGLAGLGAAVPPAPLDAPAASGPQHSVPLQQLVPELREAASGQVTPAPPSLPLITASFIRLIRLSGMPIPRNRTGTARAIASAWRGRSRGERPPIRCRRPLMLPRQRGAQRLLEPPHQQGHAGRAGPWGLRQGAQTRLLARGAGWGGGQGGQARGSAARLARSSAPAHLQRRRWRPSDAGRSPCPRPARRAPFAGMRHNQRF